MSIKESLETKEAQAARMLRALFLADPFQPALPSAQGWTQVEPFMLGQSDLAGAGRYVTVTVSK